MTDSTVTPKWLADMLPEVDFDPCSNPRSHVRARWAWSLEKSIDGLKMPWRGDGFINWPFSSPLAWAQKAIAELDIGRCSSLIVLCKMDPSTKWWNTITSTGENKLVVPPDLWMFDDRIQYEEHPEIIARRRDEYATAFERWEHAGKPPGEKPKGKADGMSSTNFVSVIIHHRGADGEALQLGSVASLWRRAGSRLGAAMYIA